MAASAAILIIARRIDTDAVTIRHGITIAGTSSILADGRIAVACVSACATVVFVILRDACILTTNLIIFADDATTGRNTGTVFIT